jgi:hypothetical protein
VRNDRFKYLRFGITYIQIKYLSNSNASLVKKSNGPCLEARLCRAKAEAQTFNHP